MANLSAANFAADCVWAIAMARARRGVLFMSMSSHFDTGTITAETAQPQRLSAKWRPVLCMIAERA